MSMVPRFGEQIFFKSPQDLFAKFTLFPDHDRQTDEMYINIFARWVLVLALICLIVFRRARASLFIVISGLVGLGLIYHFKTRQYDIIPSPVNLNARDKGVKIGHRDEKYTVRSKRPLKTAEFDKLKDCAFMFDPEHPDKPNLGRLTLQNQIRSRPTKNWQRTFDIFTKDVGRRVSKYKHIGNTHYY